jgi:flagellar basal-body rod protein FlgG
MIRGIYISAVGMLPNKLKIDVVANNLANISTAGFKRDNIFIRIFKNASSEISRSGGSELSGLDITEYTDFSQGALRRTGNPFDLAINGIGFFVIETANGLRYTRNGNFTVSPDGILITMDGNPVLGSGGRIYIPDLHRLSSASVKITENGEIYVDNQFVDKLRIVWFENPSKLKKEFSTSFSAPPDLRELKPGDNEFKIYQGFLEESNVNAVAEMVKMIEANRSYESDSKVIQHQDETLEKANELGKL